MTVQTSGRAAGRQGNDTAGSMAKDSVATAAAVVRLVTGKDLSDYDLHVNIVGGGNIDGASNDYDGTKLATGRASRDRASFDS